MRLWTAEHLGISPVDKGITDLDDWQIGLLYEIAMEYPIEGLRRHYSESKRSISVFDDQELIDAGYTLEQIREMKISK
ncbi:hypothetical protein FACS1894164_12220 [Spirochaetia bacterium]|nr:hypothetical protein FACS1894164_12220 [Spirochaetia bacterium]